MTKLHFIRITTEVNGATVDISRMSKENPYTGYRYRSYHVTDVKRFHKLINILQDGEYEECAHYSEFSVECVEFHKKELK